MLSYPVLVPEALRHRTAQYFNVRVTDQGKRIELTPATLTHHPPPVTRHSSPGSRRLGSPHPAPVTQ